MNKKKQIISYIKKIIKEQGGFSIGEIDGIDWLPPVNEMGKLVALAEYFYENYVEINIYNPNSHTSDQIADSYYLPYEKLSLELLIVIEELCDCWEAKNWETEKRISN